MLFAIFAGLVLMVVTADAGLLQVPHLCPNSENPEGVGLLVLSPSQQTSMSQPTCLATQPNIPLFNVSQS